MNITSEIGPHQGLANAINFPWIGITHDGLKVVLFVDKGEEKGTASGVQISHSQYNLDADFGHYCEVWDLDHFVPYVGTITITTGQET